MDSISTTHGNGEAGLPDSAAGELEALLAATEQAAEALKGRAREEIDSALADLTTLVAELRDADARRTLQPRGPANEEVPVLDRHRRLPDRRRCAR